MTKTNADELSEVGIFSCGLSVEANLFLLVQMLEKID